MTVAGVAGVFTGGGAYGFLAANGARTGFAIAGSSMVGGAASDLTLQGGEMLTGGRSSIDLNQTLHSTGFSLALGMGGYGFTKAFTSGPVSFELPPPTPVPGGLPDGARIIFQGRSNFVLRYPNGARTIRFDAMQATQPTGRPAIQGGFSGTPETAASISPSGRVYVSEGLHRLNSVAIDGQSVAESVLGAHGWLEYDFIGFLRTEGGPLGWGVPMNKPNLGNPWLGLEGY